MEELKKILQAFINSQNAFNQKIMKELKDVKEGLSKKIDDSEARLSKRVDALGRQIAYLEDDTPTNEDFNNLKKRVDKIERRTVAN